MEISACFPETDISTEIRPEKHTQHPLARRGGGRVVQRGRRGPAGLVSPGAGPAVPRAPRSPAGRSARRAAGPAAATWPCHPRPAPTLAGGQSCSRLVPRSFHARGTVRGTVSKAPAGPGPAWACRLTTAVTFRVTSALGPTCAVRVAGRSASSCGCPPGRPPPRDAGRARAGAPVGVSGIGRRWAGPRLRLRAAGRELRETTLRGPQ